MTTPTSFFLHDPLPFTVYSCFIRAGLVFAVYTVPLGLEWRAQVFESESLSSDLSSRIKYLYNFEQIRSLLSASAK